MSHLAIPGRLAPSREGWFRGAFRAGFGRLRRNPFGLAMLGLSALITVLALAAPLLAPYDPFKVAPAQQLQPPSAAHWLGTDDLGRDLFSRILYGGRISIRIAAIVVAISVVSGVGIGAAAGYLGGRADQFAMRMTDVFLAFPALVLAMALSAALGPSVENAALALGLVWWPSYARLTRGQFLSLKNELFVDASRALGASHVRIVAKHILPNAIDPVLVRITLTGGNAILMSSALSFVGLGAQPPLPEWGLMVAQARRYIVEAWWYPTICGLAIFMTVLAFTLAADALQDALSPTTGRTSGLT